MNKIEHCRLQMLHHRKGEISKDKPRTTELGTKPPGPSPGRAATYLKPKLLQSPSQFNSSSTHMQIQDYKRMYCHNTAASSMNMISNRSIETLATMAMTVITMMALMATTTTIVTKHNKMINCI